MTTSEILPVVYACPGCPALQHVAGRLAAQLGAWNLALVGDEVAKLATTPDGAPIIAIDGCEEACTRNALARSGVRPAIHHDLSSLGAQRNTTGSLRPGVVFQFLEHIVATLPSSAASAA